MLGPLVFSAWWDSPVLALSVLQSHLTHREGVKVTRNQSLEFEGDLGQFPGCSRSGPVGAAALRRPPAEGAAALRRPRAEAAPRRRLGLEAPTSGN